MLISKVFFKFELRGDLACFVFCLFFAKCKNLKNINLENILMIGNNAFEDCTTLDNINLDSAYAIGKRASAVVFNAPSNHSF